MIYLKKYIPYSDENKRIRLIFVGCQHYGSKQFSRNNFKKFLSEYLIDDQSYLFILGDLFDAIVSADLKRYNPEEIDKNKLINDNIQEAIEDLESYKSSILGICIGNHEYQYLRRYNLSLTQLVCERLNVQNLGISFLYRLFLRRNDIDRVRSIIIYGHHGYGGGSSFSASISKYMKKIEQFDADIYAFSHDHKSWHLKVPRIGINSAGKMCDKSIHLLCCGSFKENLLPDSISWEEIKGFGPILLGGKVIDIIPNRNSGVIIKCIH